eukprot:1169344_1
MTVQEAELPIVPGPSQLASESTDSFCRTSAGAHNHVPPPGPIRAPAAQSRRPSPPLRPPENVFENVEQTLIAIASIANEIWIAIAGNGASYGAFHDEIFSTGFRFCCAHDDSGCGYAFAIGYGFDAASGYDVNAISSATPTSICVVDVYASWTSIAIG